ncbi:TAXI family TRAP transporter solute-binding subunit [Amycolatopsis suaedae]|uniref:TAXI family TRAP transporter solute-binding subunit n=1 Tax=Amycolatopsis suaedae TaxID=2510978 RepID=A0A4Q7J0Q5_9PSEU|nr:TAXI family TRAP transporter solute-binding subunit [Amycolatopsis suaedae]RZQ59953.1 TAXI family TRAP transporter solute-binding subunit [Amycolatopsis suaedae]
MRALLALCAALTLLVSACTGADLSGTRLRIAAGSSGGVYFQLAQPLAAAWSAELGSDRPEVQQTGGSPDNLARLRAGTADVAFTAADVAATSTGRPELLALARIHDDYLHVVVRADSGITTLDGLRGRTVAIGAAESGVAVIAQQLLGVVGLDAPGSLTVRHIELGESLDALRHGQIDALFWSGGLPTGAITALANQVPLRLVDIGAAMSAMRSANPAYRSATIPRSTYPQAGGPVTTLAVPNFLVVPATMGADLAEALTRGLFAARPELAKVNPAALSIDARPAIETTPMPLHPGALRYYRSLKE